MFYFCQNICDGLFYGRLNLEKSASGKWNGRVVFIFDKLKKLEPRNSPVPGFFNLEYRQIFQSFDGSLDVLI